jgi:putative PIN family toxin of toxin-antitoxin system
VLDPCVLVAAIRTGAGASKALLAAALQSRLAFLISTPLVLEYEAVLTRREHLQAADLNIGEVQELLDMVCASGIEVPLTQRWRPQLRDPDDEMVLGTAINGQADAIVTFNRADFEGVAKGLGIEILSPGEALKRMEKA